MGTEEDGLARDRQNESHEDIGAMKQCLSNLSNYLLAKASTSCEQVWTVSGSKVSVTHFKGPQAELCLCKDHGALAWGGRTCPSDRVGMGGGQGTQCIWVMQLEDVAQL
jgi:hypothetical protein